MLLWLYIIGSLGYVDARRPGETPVFRLDCQTWKIAAVPSRGQVPGWIHKHQARRVRRHDPDLGR